MAISLADLDDETFMAKVRADAAAKYGPRPSLDQPAPAPPPPPAPPGPPVDHAADLELARLADLMLPGERWDPGRALLAAIADARPAWMDRAACRTIGPRPFFPSKASTVPQEAAQACAACLVARDCRDHARDDDVGIWGGLAEADRRRRVAA